MVDAGSTQLSPTMGDNVLSLDRAALVLGIIEGCEINVAKILAREDYDRAVSIDTKWHSRAYRCRFP